MAEQPVRAKLSHARVLELLDYNPETGLFTWKVRRGGNAQVGTVAGRLDSRGYRQVTVDLVAVLAHRLAWFYMTGAWPEHEVDHKDGGRTNNAWSNLRAVTRHQNQQNLGGCRSTNKSSGLLGVSYDADAKKYRARIGVNGKNKNIGRFETPELAHAAYCSAKAVYHTHTDRILGENNVKSAQ